MARNPKERKSPRIRRRKRTRTSTSRFYLIFGIIVILSLVIVTTATITLSTGLPTISSQNKTPSIDPVLLLSTPSSTTSKGIYQNSGFFDEVHVEGILGILRGIDRLLEVGWRVYELCTVQTGDTIPRHSYRALIEDIPRTYEG